MKPSLHLSAQSIASFPSLPHSQRAAFFRHAEECRPCGAAFLEAWQLLPRKQPARREISLASVLDRVANAEETLTRERQQAADLSRELLHHPQARRLTLIRNSRRFRTWGLCETLLAQSKDAAFRDPSTAVDLAELAQEISVTLEAQAYGEALCHDFRARACATLGNARLVTSDLRGAQEALEQAAAELQQGTGDPLEEAYVAYCRGGLRGAQRRFREATSDFDRAIAIYRRLGDSHLQAKGLIAKGIVLSKSGNPTGSIELHRKALPLIDADREPRVLLAAEHNLLLDLTNCGRHAEALEALQSVRLLHQRAGERVNLIKLNWIEGQLLHQLGKLEAAEEALLRVRQEFTELAMSYDVALVSLELATVYAEQGRTSEIKQLALQMLPIFQALEIQRETFAALILFRQAAEAETASLALIQHIAGFLKRAQHDPAARFSPPS